MIPSNPKLQNNENQYLAPRFKRKRYYTPKDIEPHNQANDIWVSLFYNVFDLTPLIQQNISSKHSCCLIRAEKECEPLIKAAGTDITYWFDQKTKEPRSVVNINTGVQSFNCPNGRYLHIADDNPNSLMESSVKTPWWRNFDDYCIGKLSQKTRKIKIINVLSDHEDLIEVPSEETINEIMERYKEINIHASSYTWKRQTKPLDMSKTLEENQIPDEVDEFKELDMPEHEWYYPAIHIYFNDDLTEA